jgi:hypothetical protein
MYGTMNVKHTFILHILLLRDSCPAPEGTAICSVFLFSYIGKTIEVCGMYIGRWSDCLVGWMTR